MVDIIKTPLSEKIAQAERVIRIAARMSEEYYGQPLAITYSGGKDSDVMLDIAMRCLKPEQIEVINSHTTVDAPPTVYYIREKFKKLTEMGIKTTIKYPKKSMWQLIVDKKIPPHRVKRYCCAYLKEASTPNRILCVGVREDESNLRKGRDAFVKKDKSKKERITYSIDHAEEVFDEAHQGLGDAFDCQMIADMKKRVEFMVNPIYKFTETDVWNYIHTYIHTYNPLYDMGFHRVGCVGCPLGGRNGMMRDFAAFPKYKELYIRAFDKMLKRYDSTREDWKTGKDVFDWWIQDPNVPGQMSFDDWLSEKEEEA